MDTFIESFLELIYPEKNICCICDIYDETIGDKFLCKGCEKSFKKIAPPTCIKCFKPINFASSEILCPDCVENFKYFEKSVSVYSYEGLIKRAIYNYKYYNKPYLYKFFSHILLNYINENDYKDYNFILSVPLHISKLRSRGYNQSELIAKYVANKMNIAYIDGLRRIKKTTKQSEQTKEERQKNLLDAFMIQNNKKTQIIKNNSVLLIDDVYTTGSTVNECTKVLLSYGVSKVYVLTVAR